MPHEMHRQFMSRFPHGKRGLKYCVDHLEILSFPSLPSWEAWIEVILAILASSSAVVASLMGSVD